MPNDKHDNPEVEEQTDAEKQHDVPAHELNEQADVISTDDAG